MIISPACLSYEKNQKILIKLLESGCFFQNEAVNLYVYEEITVFHRGVIARNHNSVISKTAKAKFSLTILHL